jgi:uncharacterized membrane protein YfcA
LSRRLQLLSTEWSLRLRAQPPSGPLQHVTELIVLPIFSALMALSLGAGFVGALSGLGGAFFIIPGLVIFAHVPMYIAIGASLISVVATSAGASVAFVRDGWTNLHIAMVLECATVTGAIIGAFMAGLIAPWVLELLFALIMLQSAYFEWTKKGDDILPKAVRSPSASSWGANCPAPAAGWRCIMA